MSVFNNYFDKYHYDKTYITGNNWQLARSTIETWERYLRCNISPHYHPYATRLRQILQTNSIKDLMDSSISELANEIPYFRDEYRPTGLVPSGSEPVDRLEFTEDGAAYAVYNWELFFHAPLAIAIGLSRSQRFQEAMKWFHFIFDPTRPRTVISDGEAGNSCWRIKPFERGEIAFAHDQLLSLAMDEPSDALKGLAAWRRAPFRPDAVARSRPVAYMLKTVMAYLDNLIAWGDSLFREDTRESINEASLLYVTAANILGARPQVIPKNRPAGRRTYHDLRNDLDEFSNIAKALETDLPLNELPLPTKTDLNPRGATTRSLGRNLYFGVPPNDKLFSYWDIVADRLFKIRNSLNLKGVFRQLPLFAPPIDPALLVKAAAAGLDVASIAAGVGQALPLVRFRVLLPKAFELCQEVKSLGAQLLAAMEKRDAEKLSILRAQHETAMLALAEDVRYRQLQEAKKALEGTKVSLANAFARYKYYERLLGEEEANLEPPELDELDLDSLRAQNFAAEEPQLERRRIDVSLADGETTLLLSPEEKEELELLADARKWSDVAGSLDAVGVGLALLPDTEAAAKPWGIGVGVVLWGGRALRASNSAAASVIRTYAAHSSASAGIAARKSGHFRRAQEWAFQSAAAAGEVNSALKQLRAAQLRECIVELEWKNHQQQIKFAEDVQQFLEGEKQTGEAFYVWMKNEVKGLHSRCYELAYDVARKAERALCHELGDSSLSFIKPSYLGGTEGLLAGEKLFLDLKRMELAYQDLNSREYELTKHISLLQLDPNALVSLRTTGECEIILPESLFDLDGPGHYFRRIKTVSLSIPCVTGPYASVNCQLTQTRSSIRVSALLTNSKYSRLVGNDARFVDIHGNVQSIVTSTAVNDSGLFEPNLQDDRYLPFEGTGAADSTWRLKLPEHAQFDYDTIADVVLHVRYTAREGGAQLREGACASVRSWIEGAGTVGLTRLFSLPHEFPTEWKRAVRSAEDLSIELRPEHYPYWLRDALHVTKCKLMIATSNGPELDFSGLGIEASGVGASDGVYLLYSGPGENANGSAELSPSREGSVRISGQLAGLEDLWLLVTVKKAE